MDLGTIFNHVAGALNDRTRHDSNVDTDGLLGHISNIFRQNGYDGPDYQSPHTGGYNGQPVLPASQDPLGDPADQGYGQQGYAQQGYSNSQEAADAQAGILPASADPLGDPADDPRYSVR